MLLSLQLFEAPPPVQVLPAWACGSALIALMSKMEEMLLERMGFFFTGRLVGGAEIWKIIFQIALPALQGK